MVLLLNRYACDRCDGLLDEDTPTLDFDLDLAVILSAFSLTNVDYATKTGFWDNNLIVAKTFQLLIDYYINMFGSDPRTYKDTAIIEVDLSDLPHLISWEWDGTATPGVHFHKKARPFRTVFPGSSKSNWKLQFP